MGLLKDRILLFFIWLLFFLGMYRYIGEFVFDTDEGDVLAGGMAIVHGIPLYKEYLSQHMPFSYFVSAFFWFFGADSVFSQRFFFYLFYSSFWLLIVIRYAKQFSRITLILSFLIFISFIGQIYLGTQILSEHLAAIGFVILFAELVRYSSCDESKFGVKESVLISFSILCTFGTTFVSAFGLLPIVIGFIVILLRKKINNSKQSLSVWRILFGCIYDCKSLITIIILPWFLFLLYCLCTNSLQDCIYWNYAFNRDIYSKYLGGYGTSISSVLLNSITTYFSHFVASVNSILTAKFSMVDLTKFALYILSLLYVIQNFLDKKYLLGFVALFLMIYTGTRGMFSFHSTPQTMLMCMFSALFLGNIYKNTEKNFQKIVVAFVFLVLFIPYLTSINEYPSFKSKNYHESEISSYIKAITNKDDVVWEFALGRNKMIMDSERVPVFQFAATPWMWDGTGMQAIEKQKNNLPKVILYNENQDVWGHKISNYAPGLSEFMANNYTKYKHLMYIRNDYYSKALSILNSYNLKSGTVIGEITKDSVFEQEVEFKQSDFSKIGLLLATFARKNKSYLYVSLIDKLSGEVIVQTRKKAWRIDDNQWMFFDVDSDDIKKDRKYIIQLKSDASHGNGVTWWFSPENSGIASLNGTVIEGGFAWMVK